MNPYVVGVLIGAVAVAAGVLVAVRVVFARANPCGGMVAEGVCSKPFNHRGKCRG